MENIEEKACLCALNRIFGFEPKIALAMISHLGSAREVFNLSPKEMEMMTGPYFKYKGQICRAAADLAAEELHSLQSKGISFCGWTEEDYPALLKECEDAPAGIYIRSISKPAELWRAPGIGVVGTRDISPYGKEWCNRIVRGLADTSCRPAIISGLAAGTDIEAHRTALQHGLATIAVMATGPDSIYPHRNRETAEKIASTPGCALVTDYPPGTAPLAIHFLRRNRIIAGLSKAVLLVESKIKGGGMATCRNAFSYNRDVYALPGRIDDTRSQGCNYLIRQKIAEPITSIESLTESLGMTRKGRGKTESDKDRLTRVFGQKISPEQLDILLTVTAEIRRHRAITIEELGASTRLGFRRASEAVHMLESEGIICIDLLQRCCINYVNV